MEDFKWGRRRRYHLICKEEWFLSESHFILSKVIYKVPLALKSSEAVSPCQGWEPAYTRLLSCTFP